MTAQPTFRLKVRQLSITRIGRLFAVVASTPTGRRFQFDTLQETQAAADRLIERVTSKGTISPDYWTEMAPEAGSRFELDLTAKARAESARTEAAAEARWAA